jgi:predicted DNA-binding transcriptional regulator AlpA
MGVHPAISEDETLVNARPLRVMLGNVSNMWLHRKLKDPGSEFPEPLVISNRRYWRLGEIRAWLDAQARKGKTRGPAAASAAASGERKTARCRTLRTGGGRRRSDPRQKQDAEALEQGS